MPKTKKQSRTKNLGVLAVKVCLLDMHSPVAYFTYFESLTQRNCSAVGSDNENEPKHPRLASPGLEATNRDSDSERSDAVSDTLSFDRESDSDEADEPGIEVYEEDDIPHPKNTAELANWLQLSDAHLAALRSGFIACSQHHQRRRTWKRTC